LHGPVIAGRKAFLFCFIDDHSRAVMAARWGYFEDSVRLSAALRPALAARGVPARLYADNGSAFVDASLKRAAARLGIVITHSAPGRPEGRGKIERFFRTVREEFLVEVGGGSAVKDLAEMNRLFTAWTETAYHARPHSETGQPPLERWLAGAPFPVPEPARLREAFLWAEHRVVRKDATLSLFGGLYQVGDLSLAGRKVECVFDPFDLFGPGGPLERAAPRPGRSPADRPPLPPEGEARAARHPAAGHRDRLPRPAAGRARAGRAPPDPLRRPRRRR
jgi:putative transposase